MSIALFRKAFVDVAHKYFADSKTSVSKPMVCGWIISREYSTEGGGTYQEDARNYDNSQGSYLLL